VVPSDRLLVVVAVVMFMGMTAVLTRTSSRPTANAITAAVVAGVVTGRIGYVAAHLSSFRDGQVSTFAIWKGGFSPITSIVGAIAVLILTLGKSAALYRSLASLGVAVTLWAGANHLLIEDTIVLCPGGSSLMRSMASRSRSTGSGASRSSSTCGRPGAARASANCRCSFGQRRRAHPCRSC
jgi:hypothetical protein